MPGGSRRVSTDEFPIERLIRLLDTLHRGPKPQRRLKAMDNEATNQRDLRIVIIGAGMSGILAAIKLHAAEYWNYTVYEKADRVGGTWRENTYPGLACDVPAHLYTYSFEPNPTWTRTFAPGPEIWKYF